MKTCLLLLFGIGIYHNAIVAQDSIVIISRLSNTQFVPLDSQVLISTLGHVPGGIYETDGLIVSFEPFDLLFGDSGPSAIRDLPSLEGIQVFPNPVMDIAILQRENYDGEYIVQLYQSDGIVTHEVKWVIGSARMDLLLADQAPGLYMLLVMNDDQTKASAIRIIKH